MATPTQTTTTTTPTLMNTLFQRSLDDIIKSVRNNPQNDTHSLTTKLLDDIRVEIKSTDLSTKSTALEKLTYLNSLHHHDMSFASFHALECVSSPHFSHKRVGYHAITLCFHDSNPVFLLVTNQLRKDLKSANEFEVCLALDCLMRIGSVDLCRDLTPDVFTLMSSSKFSVKKKALAVVLRVFDKCPDAVRVCFKRLVEGLESDGGGGSVMSVVVGVFCELVSGDPKSYLPLAPEFYKILVDSRNNWVLIKVLKIFSKLAPLEPRLAKRVVEPVCEVMRRTGAKSLLFECVRTVVSSLGEFESAVRLAVDKVREFLAEDDPNLKYLGLHALSILALKHLWAVLENKEAVIKALSDADPNIKLESLRLVMAMVSESNVADICRVLLNYALKSDPEFCNEICGSILTTCRRNVYQFILDFDWYATFLEEMSRVPHCRKGDEIESQLIDIGMRVKDVRPELVRVCRNLLIDPALLGNPFLYRVLSATAWVCGEYAEFLRDHTEIIEALLQPRTSLLPPSIRIVYLQSLWKILIFCSNSYLLEEEDIVDDMAATVRQSASNREPLESSQDETEEVGFDPRGSSHTYEDLPAIKGKDVQTSASTLEEKKKFSHESIINLFNSVELALGPLSEYYDVEIRERAQNVLGFIYLIKWEISEGSLLLQSNLEEKETRVSKIVKLMHDAVSEELGPISIGVQERIPVPDGLSLVENLANLEQICGNLQLPSSSSFSLIKPSHYGTTNATILISNIQSKEEMEEVSTESISLLAAHRKRHGLYYLPTERSETLSEDYPPANDHTLGDDTQDLVKLTEHSVVGKRKSNNAKPRPVVVKLDGDILPITAKKTEIKLDSLSGAIRDILSGEEAISASSQSNKSSEQKGKEKLIVGPPESTQPLGHGDGPDHGNSSSRKSRHRSHGKERSKKSSGKQNDKEQEDNQGKETRNARHHHRRSRNKARQEDVEHTTTAAQTTLVPDFLL